MAAPQTDTRTHRASAPARDVRRALRERVPGLVVALAVAAVTTTAGTEVPVVGGPVFGIVIGVLVAAVLHPGERWRPGFAFAAKPRRRPTPISVVVSRSTPSSRPTSLLGACLWALVGVSSLGLQALSGTL